MAGRPQLQGADPDDVQAAITSGEPFTGDAGFAGQLPDGRIVRDVLGRYPVFTHPEEPMEYAFTPQSLAAATPVPPGTVIENGESAQVWRLPDEDLYSADTVALRELRASLRDRCASIGSADVAIGYSDGVDSNLLAALIDGPRYTVGFPDNKALDHARKAATALHEQVRTIELTHTDVLEAIPIVARAIDRTNAMDMAIGLSLYLLADRVNADGYQYLVLGQGADELFGGYEKIAHPDHRVAADTIRGARREVLQGLPGGLGRDVLAVRAAGVEPIMPYLGDNIVRRALRLREDQLVRAGTRKWILRAVADDWLPDSIAQRDKSAIQYGNGVATELDRLARQAGYKRRMPNHVRQFVRSHLDRYTSTA